MNYAHFMYIPWTGLGKHNGFRGDDWLKNRIRVFQQFVLPSLMTQTNQGFVVWMSWRPEEKENPIVKSFVKSLEGIRDFNVVHTFHGICFYDDKYPNETAIQRLTASLEGTLPELHDWVQGRQVLMTIQPSDDMYLSTAVEDIQHAFRTPNVQAVGYKKGYIMNYATKEIAEYSCEPYKTDDISTYHTDTDPPFYTLRFEPDVFLNAQKHLAYTSLKEDVYQDGKLLYTKGTPLPSHEHVSKCLKMKFLDYRGFVVGIHGANISTVWHHRYKGKSLTAEEQDAILIKTGTWFAEPFVLTPFTLPA